MLYHLSTLKGPGFEKKYAKNAMSKPRARSNFRVIPLRKLEVAIRPRGAGNAHGT